MAIKLIDGPQILVSELPVSLAVDDDAPYRRSYLQLPEPHAYRRLFGVLNACTVDPFLTEFWLNNSKPSGLSVLVAPSPGTAQGRWLRRTERPSHPGQRLCH
jgi:hypothetical protein